MSLTIAYPSQTVVTTGTTVRVAELPLGTRAMPTLTATVAAAGTNVTVTMGATAAVLGATSLTVVALPAALPNRARIRFANGAQAILTAAAAAAATTLSVAYLSQDVAAGVTGTWNAGSLAIGSMYVPVNALVDQIDAGATLTFTGNNTVTVTDYCPAGSTVLEVLPTTVALTAGNTATYLALLNLSGATNATPSPQPKTVDTTTYLSGIGKEMVVTQVSATLKVEYNLQVGDKGGDVISSIMLTPAKYNREIFAQISRPSDGIYQGAAIVTQSSDTAPVQDIAKRSVDMQFQGVSFSFTSFPRF
jgi:hypothetical protein